MSRSDSPRWRKIFSSGPLQGEQGYNQYVWNCADGDGDRIASGSYIFMVRLNAQSSTEQVDSHTGIVAVVR